MVFPHYSAGSRSGGPEGVRCHLASYYLLSHWFLPHVFVKEHAYEAHERPPSPSDRASYTSQWPSATSRGTLPTLALALG